MASVESRSRSVAFIPTLAGTESYNSVLTFSLSITWCIVKESNLSGVWNNDTGCAIMCNQAGVIFIIGGRQILRVRAAAKCNVRSVVGIPWVWCSDLSSDGKSKCFDIFCTLFREQYQELMLQSVFWGQKVFISGRGQTYTTRMLVTGRSLSMSSLFENIIILQNCGDLCQTGWDVELLCQTSVAIGKHRDTLSLQPWGPG